MRLVDPRHLLLPACPILPTLRPGPVRVAVGLLPLLSVSGAPSAGRFGDNKVRAPGLH